MQVINIISVGNLKEQYLKDAVGEYEKRLSRFCKLNLIELKEKTFHQESEQLAEKTLQLEAEEIIPQLKGFVVVLDKSGKNFSSEEFADLIGNVALKGESVISFVIGSSFGIHQSVKEKANLLFSFSRLTFPHQLFKVMMLEQLYRAFTINNNIKYHK